MNDTTDQEKKIIEVYNLGKAAYEAGERAAAVPWSYGRYHHAWLAGWYMGSCK